MTRSLPRARWVALFTIVAISFVSGGWLLRPAPSAEGGIYQQARLFEHVVAAIHRHYIDSMGEGDLYQRAATALVGSLQDPYAELLIQEEYREYQRQMTGTEVDFDLETVPPSPGSTAGRRPLQARRRGAEHRRPEHHRLVGQAPRRGAPSRAASRPSP